MKILYFDQEYLMYPGAKRPIFAQKIGHLMKTYQVIYLNFRAKTEALRK